MADEDKIQKQMEFIISQQAQFASDIQQLRETQATTENLLGRLTTGITVGFKKLDEKFATLAVAQAQTDQKLNDLMNRRRRDKSSS